MDYKYTKFTGKGSLNYIKIPVNIFEFNDDGAEEFNSIIDYWRDQYESWNTIKRTPSGGICKKKGIFKMPAWDFQEGKNFIELTVLTTDCCARYKMTTQGKSIVESGMSGRKAFVEFMNTCKRYGIDLKSFAITNGEEIKSTIQPAMIKVMNPKMLGKTYRNAHHIDLNSSYMSGIMKAFPALESPIRDVYVHRNSDNKKYKAVLNMSFGFFQSKYCRINTYGYALAQMSKAAIDYNNEFINNLLEKLIETGRCPILINTDGIWYTGDVYHDGDEGTDLGQWKNDHVNCTLRVKSNGAYEYMEDGKYHAVVRGSTRLDKLIDREDWQWGDIYKYDAISILTYRFDRKNLKIVGSTEVL